ncbi:MULTISPECIES: DUF3040 domain-containing protein [unclassified Streptomyces]|uniref:DUF3040 domain-containing protein n=1 Tax=unclassified Streptomyces TaxID=2593676 RepID=UPI00056723BF|nr:MULTISPECIES: DUF3040 domain-containing protein [unclassified Streptomyces]MYT28556.1 DUF3040 domain-containing protein [Streptomyces sp. SID8354]
MSLPMRDRRVLAQIEEYFLADDPELALLLSTFGESPQRRRRLLRGIRRRAGAALAYTAVAVGAVLLVAACLARSAAVLWAAGAMALVSAAPFLTSRFHHSPGRRAPSDHRRGVHD